MIPVNFPLIHGDVPRPFYTTPPTPDGSIPLVINDSNNHNNPLNNLILAGPHPGLAMGPSGVNGMPYHVPFFPTGRNDISLVGSFGRNMHPQMNPMNMHPQMNPMNMPHMGMYPPGVPNPFNRYGGPYGGPPPLAILSVDPTRRFSNPAARDAYDGIKKHLGRYSKRNSDNNKVVWIEEIGGKRFVHKLMDKDSKQNIITGGPNVINANTYLETSFFLPNYNGSPPNDGKVVSTANGNLQVVSPHLEINREGSDWKIVVKGESVSHNYWVISKLLTGTWGDPTTMVDPIKAVLPADIADAQTSANKTLVQTAAGLSQVIKK